MEKKARSPKERMILAGAILPAGLAPALVGALNKGILVGWGVVFLALILYLLLRPAWGKGFVKLAVAFISLSAAITALDLVLRALPFIQTRLHYRPHDLYNYHLPACPELLRYKESVQYEGRVFGDLAAVSGESREWRDVTFRTDELGFRNEPGARSRENDVILLGDSFGMGMDTSQEKIWSSVLEERYGILVYNLSIPGNAWAELMNLMAEHPNIRVREGGVVLWALFAGNDLANYFGDPWSLKEEGFLKRVITRLETFRARSVLRQMLKRIELLLFPPTSSQVVSRHLPDGNKILFYSPYVLGANDSWEAVKGYKNYPRLEEVFSSMKAFTSAQGLKVAVASIPSKAEVYSWVLKDEEPWSAPETPSGFSELLRELCEKKGFAFLDLKPRLVEEAKALYAKEGGLLWWRDDTHWNEKGHAVAAKSVYEELLRPLIPSRPSSTR